MGMAIRFEMMTSLRNSNSPITAIFLGYFIQNPGYPVTVSLLGVLLILETVLLIWYVTRIRRDLLKLLLALENEDPTLRFSKEGKDPYFNAIHRGFNEIIRNFKLVRLDRGAEQKFFEASINHIQFGILAFETDGKVKPVNQAFLELFELKGVAPELPEWLLELEHSTESFRKLNLKGTPYHLIFLASQMKILGTGLSRFMDAYSNLYRVPELEFIECFLRPARTTRI